MKMKTCEYKIVTTYEDGTKRVETSNLSTVQAVMKACSYSSLYQCGSIININILLMGHSEAIVRTQAYLLKREIRYFFYRVKKWLEKRKNQQLSPENGKNYK